MGPGNTYSRANQIVVAAECFQNDSSCSTCPAWPCIWLQGGTGGPTWRGTSTRDVVFAQHDGFSSPTHNALFLYCISLLHVVWECGVSGLEDSRITLPSCVLLDHTQYRWEEIISEDIAAQGTELEALP